MSYKCITFNREDVEFFELIRLLNKIQYRKTSKHLMTSHEVKKVMHLHENALPLGAAVYTDFHSAYSIKGFKFKRWCTCFRMNNNGGSISWKEAPEVLYGRADRFTVTIIDPIGYMENVASRFPELKRIPSGADNHLILSGD